MSASQTALRLITLLFLLAGILLLRKPVFGQTNVTAPQIRVAHSPANPPVTIIESATVPCTSNWHRIDKKAVCVESLQPQSR